MGAGRLFGPAHGQLATLAAVQCTRCLGQDTRVVDSRPADEGVAIRRRRECGECGHRFTTFERSEERALLVRKRSGQRVPFERTRVEAGLLAATKGRPVLLEEIHRIASEIEAEMRMLASEPTTEHVGRSVLERLQALDKVAYLRFASVYKGFEDPADFRRELELLEAPGREAAG